MDVAAVTPMVRVKPWMIKGRRMERNAPQGYRCDSTCTHPTPQLNTKTSLCPVCHETFSTPRNFDTHRKDGWCLDPATVGLVRGANEHWVQAWPEGASKHWDGTPGMDEED